MAFGSVPAQCSSFPLLDNGHLGALHWGGSEQGGKMFFYQCIAVGAAIGVVLGLCEILASIWRLAFGVAEEDAEEDAKDLKSPPPSA